MNKEDIRTLVKQEIKNQVVTEEYVPETLYEKLSVSDGIETWIKDFQQSDAPQFKGKDKDKRRKMAVAAYMAAERKEGKKKKKGLRKVVDKVKSKFKKKK